ncbi:MAG: hypothetical protein HC875_02885 [Anaerolineales bacterium]|nr:hypothetical protein [Anaerolineales bacterium]
MSAYRLSDAELFFGRQRAITELIRHLARDRLTILHAESGAGKSSLLQAGLMPRLLGQGHLPVYLRSDISPSLAIKQAFVPDLADVPELHKISLPGFLRQVTAVLGLTTHLYLLLDQFEEVYTLLNETERASFLDELGKCLNDQALSRVHWVLAVRSEFFSNISDLY